MFRPSATPSPPPTVSPGMVPGEGFDAAVISAAQGMQALQHQMHNSVTYQQHIEQLDAFWQQQVAEVEKMSAEDFKNHTLPLARIKKIMKLDEDVRTHQMISAEAPVLFAKACEMFILELTHRAWIHTEENKRRTLQRNDIAMAISKTDIFDFLIDIVPREELQKPVQWADTDRFNMTSEQMQHYWQWQQLWLQQWQQMQQHGGQMDSSHLSSDGQGPTCDVFPPYPQFMQPYQYNEASPQAEHSSQTVIETHESISENLSSPKSKTF